MCSTGPSAKARGTSRRALRGNTNRSRAARENACAVLRKTEPGVCNRPYSGFRASTEHVAPPTRTVIRSPGDGPAVLKYTHALPLASACQLSACPAGSVTHRHRLAGPVERTSTFVVLVVAAMACRDRACSRPATAARGLAWR